MTLSTLTAATNSSMYGSAHASRRHFRLMRKSHLIFGVERQCLWHQYLQNLPSIGHYDTPRQRNFLVEAGWLFKGGDQGSDASSERSDSANEDILIFFYQLDLATRVQYALNLEQYEIAQQLRNKLTEVDAELIKQQESAIESENYTLAAELRDEISKLEADSLAASVKAQAYEKADYVFRLGQKVQHKKFGYRAVVCGMDPVCCESRSWMETACVEQLTRGSDQPYYQVLVDVRADPNLLVAYVPEENLVAPDEPDLGRFDHPYASFLFYGVDAAGDFIPVKQLREKYNRPRHELPYDDPQDGNSGEDA